MNILYCIFAIIFVARARKLTRQESKILTRNCGRFVPGYNTEVKNEVEDQFKVLYGNPVPFGGAPWAVAVSVKMDEEVSRRFGGYQKFSQLGTGTLVSPYHIVTAAHLVGLSEKPLPDCERGALNDAYFLKDPHEFTVFLNVTCATPELCAVRNRSDVFEEREVRSIFIRKGYVGDGCSRRESNNDLAVFELAEPVRFSRFVFPACLPTRKMELDGIRDVRLFGYGRDASLEVRNSGILRILRSEVDKCPDEFQAPGLFCTASSTKGLSCDGDSGAGVVYTPPRRRSEMLIGVLSAGINCGELHKRHQNEKKRLAALTQEHDILIDVSHHLRFFCECCGICN